MPAEAIAEPQIAVAPELAEKEYTAAEFCMAFASIHLAQREAAAEIMNVPVEKLNAQYIGTHYDVPENSMKVISKIGEVMGSGLCRDRVERFADRQPSGGMLHDQTMVDFLSDLSSLCFVGAASQYLLDKHRYFQRKEDKRLAKIRVVQTHEQFVKLADSEYGRQLGVDRRHLRFMANIMFGKEEAPSNLPVWFEVGVSAEIATKRGLERLAADKEVGPIVRYATVEEDIKGADVVVAKNRTRLFIDVKSSNRSASASEDRFAFHTPIEKVDFETDTYRIKELHPAGIESIGNNFSIDSEYVRELRKVLDEFEALT